MCACPERRPLQLRIRGPRGSPTPPATGHGACRRTRRCGGATGIARGAVDRHFRPSQRPVLPRPGEAHGEQHQIGLQLEGLAVPLAFERLDRASPTKRRVTTEKPRSQPSSCEEEVRSFIGQCGQVERLVLALGGSARISSWVTEAAPWRFAVPMQSGAGVAAADDDDVLAGREDRRAVDRIARRRAILLDQIVHREMDAVELAARHRQVARLLGAAGEDEDVDNRPSAARPARRRRPPCRCGRSPLPPPSGRCAGRSALRPS